MRWSKAGFKPKSENALTFPLNGVGEWGFSHGVRLEIIKKEQHLQHLKIFQFHWLLFPNFAQLGC